MTLAPQWSQDTTCDELWAVRGACTTLDPDELFGQGSQQRVAREVCRACPVIAECLADALDNRTPFGVWGGMTERERRALLRAKPRVRSWARMFDVARNDCGSAGAH